MKTNNEMIADIMAELDNASAKKRISGKATAILIVTISIILCIGIGAFAAKLYLPMLSDEWKEELSIKAENADKKETAEEFRERMKNTDDIYSQNGVKHGHDEVIMNYESSVPVNLVQKSGELLYSFKSVTEAEVLRLTGSLVAGTQFEWQIQKRYFALFEITRADGQTLTEEDYAPFRFLHFVDGYDPLTTNMALEGECPWIQINTDDVYYYAVDITEMLIFAEHDLYLTAVDMDGGFDITRHISTDENGGIMLRDTAPEKSVMFRFSLDKSFGDKKAEMQFIREHGIS